jgi:hypothetical protein
MNQKFKQHKQTKLNVADIANFLDQVNQIRLRLGPTNWCNEWKQYIQKHGIQGIGNLRPTLPKMYLQEIRMKIAEQIVRLSLDHPSWGAEHLSVELQSSNIRISPSSVYNILLKYQIGTKYQRLLKLKANTSTLTPEQLGMLEKLKSGTKKPYKRGNRPGELLAQATVFVGYFQNIGELYLQTVFDFYSNYAFGALHIGKHPDDAVLILDNEVLPFFNNVQISVSAILTDNSRIYSGNTMHHYELYLKLNDIEHQRLNSKKAQDSPIKQFIGIFDLEFLNWNNLFKETDKIATLQIQLNEWLTDYNYQRPAPNMGKTPFTMIRDYSDKSSESKPFPDK